METIGAIASVGGIIQLVVYGARTVKYLQNIYDDSDDSECQEFIHGLVKSGQLLHDVQHLCIRIQKHKNPLISQIRLVSLKIQLEDCISDLEHWQKVTVEIDTGKDRRVSKLMKRYAGQKAVSTTEKFQRFASLVFKHDSGYASREVRIAVQNRVERHQVSIGTALAILQADLNFLQLDALTSVDKRVESLNQLTVQNEEQRAQRHSDRDSSHSSLLSWSISHDERLKELQSVSSDLSEQMRLVLRALSDVSSGAASASNPESSLLSQTVAVDTTSIGAEQPEQQTDDAGNIDGAAASTADERIDGEDMSAVHCLLDDLHHLARQYFDGVVLEYLITVEKWRAALVRQRLLDTVQASAQEPPVRRGDEINVNVSQIEQHLIATRRRALSESLSGSLAEADKLLGINEAHIKSWESLSKQRIVESKGVLQRIKTLLRADKSEAAIRMNEWLLLVMLSNQHLAKTHKSLVRFTYRSQAGPVVGPIYDGFARTINRQLQRMDPDRETELERNHRRLATKFWLSDGSDAWTSDNYAASASVGSRESERTMVPYTSGDMTESERENDDDDEDGEDGGQRSRLLLQLELPDDPRLTADEENDSRSFAFLFPKGATPLLIERAWATLDKYKLEPARQQTQVPEQLAPLLQERLRVPLPLTVPSDLVAIAGAEQRLGGKTLDELTTKLECLRGPLPWRIPSDLDIESPLRRGEVY